MASPFAVTHPAAAACFALGSVLPDLDAFSRLFGRRAFMEVHQTYSHALPVIAAIGGAAWAAFRLAGIPAPYGAAALMLGMLFHSALDVTNTYGITLLAPFTRRRFCTEWVFFIDATVIAATILALGGLAWQWTATGEPGWQAQAAWGVAMAAYWAAKVALKRRAQRLAPAGTVSLLPSALVPWEFLGCARDGAEARLFRLNALSGGSSGEERVALRDDAWLRALETLPEFRTMRALSPAYHVVSAEPSDGGTLVLCRDLRTRNFRTRFGEIAALVDPAGALARAEFHV